MGGAAEGRCRRAAAPADSHVPCTPRQKRLEPCDSSAERNRPDRATPVRAPQQISESPPPTCAIGRGHQTDTMGGTRVGPQERSNTTHPSATVPKSKRPERRAPRFYIPWRVPASAMSTPHRGTSSRQGRVPMSGIGGQQLAPRSHRAVGGRRAIHVRPEARACTAPKAGEKSLIDQVQKQNERGNKKGLGGWVAPVGWSRTQRLRAAK